MTVSKIIQILRSKSLKYIIFRSKYEFERKIGLLKRKFPMAPGFVPCLSLEDWKNAPQKYLFSSREDIIYNKTPNKALSHDVDKICHGNIRMFYGDWAHIGVDYDWVTNPSNGFVYDVSKHWSQIDDLDETAGDIKFVWEKSRFCFLYSIILNDYHNEEDHSEFVFLQILDWIDHNPLNCGPNYLCSQEISVRLMNWTFALYFYKNSPSLSEERWKKIALSMYWQFDHVYKNINFSRIAVRNNHAITETLALYFAGLLFPQFPNAAKWKRNGKRWFEQEIEYQFEPDGTYVQNSMNYQRVVTQLLTLAIALAEKNGEKFSRIVYDRAYANIEFLYQFLDDETGLMPNYGANDGALFFLWHAQDYSDFRPQIKDLESLLVKLGYSPLKKHLGMISFPYGGYYLIRDGKTLSFLRCGGFKGICPPDQLHLDVFVGSRNVLMDSGSYKYNTSMDLVRYFSGTESHNSIMLGDCDQMQKGPRFIWLFPPIIEGCRTEETEDAYIVEAKIVAFRHVADGIMIKRFMKKFKGQNRWEIEDKVEGKPDGMQMRQIWHTCDSIDFLSSARRIVKNGHFSRYYGTMSDNMQIEFVSEDNTIKTIITVV